MQLPRWLRWRTERELQEEIDAHLDVETQAQMERGLTPEEARLAARRAFGNPTLTREHAREAGLLFRLEMLWRDVLYEGHRLIQTPFMALAVIATLTIGIGVNVTVFSLTNALFFRPQVVKDPGSYAHIVSVAPAGEARRTPLQWRTEDYEAMLPAQSFAHLTARGGALLAERIARRGFVVMVSCNYFDAHYNRPLIGRAFLPEDCAPGAPPVAVLPESQWRNLFGQSPDVLGQTLQTNQIGLTIVGVVQDAMVKEDAQTLAWAPLNPDLRGAQGGRQAPASAGWLNLTARLKPGVTYRQAEAELATIQPQGRLAARVTNGSEFADNNQSNPEGYLMLALMVIVCGMVLVLICTNVTTLLLARAAARRQEMAVRAALGAGRARLIRQSLVECLLMALVSSAASLWIAASVGRRFFSLAEIPSQLVSALDWRVYSFTLGIAVLAGCVAGLPPALEALRFHLSDSLRPKGRGAMGPGHSRLRTALIATQLTVSLVALVAAGLVIRTQVRMRTLDRGFDPGKVVISWFLWGTSEFSPAQERAFFRELEQNLATTPGVAAVGLSSTAPFLGFGDSGRAQVRTVQNPGGPAQEAKQRVVSSGFFDAFGLRATRGRLFSAEEYGEPASVAPAVVSEALARAAWPDQEPLGKHFWFGSGEAVVVGVTTDSSTEEAGQVDGPVFYRPLDPNGSMRIQAMSIRMTTDPRAMMQALSDRVRQLDTRIPMMTPTTIAQLIDRNLEDLNRAIKSVSIVAGLILFLAVLGIYGVASFSVTQRHQEIGVRLALGAHKSDIVRTLLKSAAKPLAVGLFCGILLAWAGGALVTHNLKGVNATDPLAYLGAIAIVAGTALLATYIPAHRAARLDPWRTLRDE